MNDFGAASSPRGKCQPEIGKFGKEGAWVFTKRMRVGEPWYNMEQNDCSRDGAGQSGGVGLCYEVFEGLYDHDEEGMLMNSERLFAGLMYLHKSISYESDFAWM